MIIYVIMLLLRKNTARAIISKNNDSINFKFPINFQGCPITPIKINPEEEADTYPVKLYH